MSDTSVVITNYIFARRRKDALLTSSAIYFLPLSISGTSGAQVPLGETGPLTRAALRELLAWNLDSERSWARRHAEHEHWLTAAHLGLAERLN